MAPTQKNKLRNLFFVEKGGIRSARLWVCNDADSVGLRATRPLMEGAAADLTTEEDGGGSAQQLIALK